MGYFSKKYIFLTNYIVKHVSYFNIGNKPDKIN